MEKMIRVKLEDGSVCRMSKKAFYVFLKQGKVAEFERTDGWVCATKVPTRKASRAADYTGPERRAV